MSVRNAFRASASAVFGSVAATAQSITHGADAMALLAETGKLHAKAYRDDTEADLAENAVRRRTLRVARAKVEISRELVEIKRELDEDEALSELFHAIDDGLFLPKT